MEERSSGDDRIRCAASPWLGDRPPHLPCRRGELPAAVLFPGDPARVDRFATLLEDFRIVGQNREFRVGVGRWQGVELGVCSTGIGGPSTEIALVEAAELGCRFALRVGGTGALDSMIPLGSLLVVEEALRGGGAASWYALQEHRARPDAEMLAELVCSAQASGVAYRLATVASTDGYYAAQGRVFPRASGDASDILNVYRERGAAALDMEAESIFVIGERLGLRAGVLLAVHANRASDTWLEDFEPAQMAMLRIGCTAMAAMAQKGA
jgi:uridine phosphorylase